jgi:transposase
MIRVMRREALTLTIQERTELQRRLRTRSRPAGEARIARLMLLLAEGRTYADIRTRLSCTPTFIAQWKKRFLTERLAGLHSRHRGRQARVLTPSLEARILSWTRRRPPDGSTH